MKTTKIYLESGYLLDSSYERAVENEKTIARLVPVMQSAWDELGSRYVEATLRAIGREFRRSELTAYLIMHPNLFSCSHPFLININRFLDFDPGATDHVMRFSELVYHELLHIYLVDNYFDFLDPSSTSASPLLKQFTHEGDTVLAHLHLYAVQKEVFTSNGWPHIWDWVAENAKSLHNPGYHRATEIIQEVGHERFVDELK